MTTDQLIFTADDFGRSEAINRAVIQAHKEGVLTAASLMVAGDAFEQAVDLARQNSTLAVGLHVVVINGRSVLPQGQIPHLVDRSRQFSNNPTTAGIRYFFSRAARAELKLELRSQFEKFAGTGLPLSHVDGHLHMHVHPTVLKMILPLAREFGAVGFRLPRDSLAAACRYSTRHFLAKTTRVTALRLLSFWAGRYTRPFQTVGHVFGIAQSGQMTVEYVQQILSQTLDNPAELIFHPTTGPRLDELGPNPEDLLTLLNPGVRSRLAKENRRSISYPLLNIANRS